MALQRITGNMGVGDACIAIGASKYYLYSGKEFSLDPEIIHAIFEGNSMTLGGHSAFSGKGTGKITAGMWSLEAIAAMTGETVSSAGVTPNIVDTLSHVAATNFPEFILYVKTQEISEGGAAGTKPAMNGKKVYRCKLTALPMGLEEKGYKVCDVTFECYPDLTTKKFIDDINYETAVAL